MNRRHFLTRSLAGTALTAIAPTCFSSSADSTSDVGRLPRRSPREGGFGVRPCGSAGYSRLFPSLTKNPNPADEPWLIQLGQNMKDAPDARPDPKYPPPLAGYT